MSEAVGVDEEEGKKCKAKVGKCNRRESERESEGGRRCSCAPRIILGNCPIPELPKEKRGDIVNVEQEESPSDRYSSYGRRSKHTSFEFAFVKQEAGREGGRCVCLKRLEESE